MILRRRYQFEASHVLPRHPGRCRRLHGHSYAFVVELDGPIDPVQGFIFDFDQLDEVVEEHVIARLDHQHLNEIIENPTAEYIAIWIYRRLRKELDILAAVEVFEVEGASVLYRGEAESE